MAFVALSLCTAAAACGGDDDASGTPSSSPTATATAVATESPTPSMTATPTAAAVGTPPADIADFRAFAAQVSDAILGHDTVFFTSRARSVQITCKGDEQLGPCSGRSAGEIIEGIPGSAWRSDASAIFSADEYRTNLERYFAAPIEGASDQYGNGALVLFALGMHTASDSQIYFAVTTSILDIYPSTNYPIGTQEREAHVLQFEPNSDGWSFVGEIAAGTHVTSVDWLSGQCSECYDYWEPWQGATN